MKFSINQSSAALGESERSILTQEETMKFTRFSIIVTTLILNVSLVANIQAQTKRPRATTPVTTQTATTEDGRKVILKSNGTWQYDAQDSSVADTTGTTSRPKGKANSTLSFDTGLVFKSGDVKPMARTTFYLLDDSVENIMKAADVTNGADMSLFSGSSLHQTLSLSYYGKNLEKYSVVYAKTMEAIKPHIIATVTTDFSGKGQFEAVPAGTYYLFGIGQIFKEVAVWDLKADLKSGQNSLTLDQNNLANR